MTKFSSQHFLLVYVPRDLSVSLNSVRNDFEVHITPWQRIERSFFFALILTPSLLGYFIVPGLLGDLKRVLGYLFGSTVSIRSF